jgi:hypothetical protein
MFPQLTATNLPSIVWFQDVSDDQTIKKIDGAIMGNEQVGIALKRFNCFRVNVLDLPEGELKKKHLKEAPAFYFFTPDAKLSNKVYGKRATSLSSVSKLIEGLWNESYDKSHKEFCKEYKAVLDAFDGADLEKQKNDRLQAKLDEGANPSLEKKLKAQKEVVANMTKEIEEMEQKILGSFKLKAKYLPEETAEGSN